MVWLGAAGAGIFSTQCGGLLDAPAGWKNAVWRQFEISKGTVGAASLLVKHHSSLETELAELHGELKESQGKIATLVLMWSGVSRELAKAEAKLRQVQGVSETALHPVQMSEAVIPEGLEVYQGSPAPSVQK